MGESHYFITNGDIGWASAWNEDRIEREQERDKSAKKDFFDSSDLGMSAHEKQSQEPFRRIQKMKAWWTRK